MRRAFLTLCTLLMGAATFSQQLDSTWPGVNGPVYTIYKHPTNNTVYIGGQFTRLGTETPYLALFNKTSGNLTASLPFPDDKVVAALPDGSGGYYIGGDFTMVNDQAHKYAAHIDATGQLTAWNPDVDGTVTDIEMSGNTIYICGQFNNAGGQARKNIAAVDATTGTLKSWYPGAVDGYITCFTISDTTIFVAGQFSTIGVTSRDKIAQVGLSTGNLTSFSITLTGGIEDMVVDKDTLYLGGSIFSVNGQARQNIAALTISDATLKPLAPAVQSGHVIDIELDGNILYMTGNFSSVGSLPRDGAASVNVNTGLVTGWAPAAATLSPWHLAIDGNNVYLGGNGIAAYNKNTGVLTGSMILIDGTVYSICPGSGSIFIAGDFHSFDYKERMGIAALDVTTHKLLSWDPNMGQNSIIRTITGSGNSLYIGGDFDYVNGQIRNSLAEVNATTAALAPFAPSSSWSWGITTSTINTIAVDGNTLYVGGRFDNMGGLQRNHAAAFDRTTGNITNWDPEPSSIVHVIRVNSGNVYMAGEFPSVGSYMRNGIAAVSAAGTVLPWDPNPVGFNSSVNDIKIVGSSVYLAGGFDSVGGQRQRQLAEVDLSTGLCNTSFSPRIRSIGVANAVEVVRDSVYVGGLFTLDTPVFVSVLGAVNVKDGLGTSWDPNVWTNGLGITVLTTDTNNLYVGGQFHRVNGKPRNNFAVYKLPPGPAPSSGITGVNTEPAIFTVWPNPATGGKFNCRFTSPRQQPLTLTVTDITGRTLYKQIVFAQPSTNDLTVTLDNVGKQLLMISLKGEGVQYATQKLIME